jgi:hypothetical protein
MTLQTFEHAPHATIEIITAFAGGCELLARRKSSRRTFTWDQGSPGRDDAVLCTMQERAAELMS